MRILWLSNAPWCRTGYGVQTALFARRLNECGKREAGDLHQVAIQAFWGLAGGQMDWNGIRVYPLAYHPYGMDALEANADDWEADVVVTLLDAWVLEPPMMREIKWCPWFPIDHEPLPERVRRVVNESWQPLVFSRFGERMAIEAGLDPLYVPHGVETDTYFPIEGGKAEARKALGWDWAEEAFVIGMVAANKGLPSRKAFPQHLAAFARFHRRHPKSVLYVHSAAGAYGEEKGVNLPELAEKLGIKEAVVFCNQYRNMLGFSEEHMRRVYNALDVLVNVSTGEGFGVPIVEAQACGCPVIVGDWTAMGELCFGGYTVPKCDAEPFWTPLAAYQFLPHIDAIEAALERAFDDASRREEGWRAMRERARAGAMAYDADRVTREYWLPALERIERKIKLMGN
jgi:glycosyltransferase involved in cell wall biosynthesis